MTDPLNAEGVEAALLPCPFCGGRAQAIGYGPYHVACSVCGAKIKSQFVTSINDTIATWNHRVSVLQAQIKALTEERDTSLRLLQLSHKARSLRDAEFRALTAEARATEAERQLEGVPDDPTGELRDRADALWQDLFPLMQSEGSAAGVYADKVAALALIEGTLETALPALTPSTGTREDGLRETLTNARSMLITLAGDPRKFIAEDRGGMGDKTQAALLDQLDNALAQITEGTPKP